MPKNTDATEAFDMAERRASQLVGSSESMLRSVADVQRVMLTESLRVATDTTSALLHLETPVLAAGLRFLDLASTSGSQVLEFWMGSRGRTPSPLRELWSSFSGQAEQMLQTSEHAAERLTERVASEAEHIAEDAQAALRQREQHEREHRQREEKELQAERERDQHEREREQARLVAVREQQEREAAERPAINVVKREDDWAVVRDNATRATAVFDTKREAVERARELAKRDNSELHIGTAAEAERAADKQPKPEQGEKPARA